MACRRAFAVLLVAAATLRFADGSNRRAVDGAQGTAPALCNCSSGLAGRIAANAQRVQVPAAVVESTALATYSFGLPSGEHDTSAVTSASLSSLISAMGTSPMALHVLFCPGAPRRVPSAVTVQSCPWRGDRIVQHQGKQRGGGVCFTVRVLHIQAVLLSRLAPSYRNVMFVELDMIWLLHPLSLFHDALLWDPTNGPAGRGGTGGAPAARAAPACDLLVTLVCRKVGGARSEAHLARSNRTTCAINTGSQLFVRPGEATRHFWDRVTNMTSARADVRCMGGQNQDAMLEAMGGVPYEWRRNDFHIKLDAFQVGAASSVLTSEGVRVCGVDYESRVGPDALTRGAHSRGDTLCLSDLEREHPAEFSRLTLLHLKSAQRVGAAGNYLARLAAETRPCPPPSDGANS